MTFMECVTLIERLAGAVFWLLAVWFFIGVLAGRYRFLVTAERRTSEPDAGSTQEPP